MTIVLQTRIVTGFFYICNWSDVLFVSTTYLDWLHLVKIKAITTNCLFEAKFKNIYPDFQKDPSIVDKDFIC